MTPTLQMERWETLRSTWLVKGHITDEKESVSKDCVLRAQALAEPRPAKAVGLAVWVSLCLHMS